MAAAGNPLQDLTECFRQSLLPDPVPRKRAEDYLKEAANQPNYGVMVLQLVAGHSVDLQIRLAAAVNFKNHVKYHWDASEHEELQVSPMQDAEKQQIKTHITTLMLSTPPQVQAQLSEALSIISNYDFPSKWPSLLPELVEKLRSATDPVVINGVLQTANSIFKRFRFQFKSDELFGELKYVLNLFCEPLLEFVQRMGQLIAASENDAVALRAVFPCLRLACRIFYSLNFQDLPEFFEDHMKEWMDQFHLYLTYDNPRLEESDPDKESVADQVKAAVCENINLYMSKYEEEFRSYLQMFVTDVWSLLMKVGLSASHDKLAITSIKFLTTVARSVHHELFNQAEVVQQICEKIVVPNLRMRDDDEELFEMNHVEYIRRDMEGSDTDTRRRTACELVKGLTTYYEQQVTQLFGQYVTLMLQTYAANPAVNWKEKDCAIYLVVALTVRQKTAAQGATATNQLVNIGDFFTAQIEPELKKTDGSPVLRADALKFVTTFRSQIPKAACLSLFPHLVALLLDEHNVVHSYAAHAIERLLVVKDGGRPRFTPQDLAPFTQQLLSNLFGALKLPDSQENDYVMKCIMRMISSSPVAQYAEGVLAQLTDILKAVCKNPTQPGFNHYLFEAVAALIKQTCAANPARLDVFEKKLFPVFDIVLQDDVAEFMPYVFQILSQLVELRPAPLPTIYMALFSPLLTPLLWERSANVPALVRLLQAYLQKAPQEIISQQKLPAVLGVFQKLIASRHTDHQGFFILNTVVESLPVDAVRPYLTPLWTLLFTRLSKSRTVKFVKALVVFLSLFIVKYGATELVESLEKLQAGIYRELLGGVWLGSTERGGAISITGDIEVKVTSVATTKLLCECPPMADDASLQLWGKLLDTEVALLERSEEATVAQEENDVLEVDEIPGYAASYAQLHNAHKEYQDPLSEVEDARRYLTESLAKFTAQSPGKFLPVIQQSLEKKHQDALLRYCATYGQNIS